MVKVEAQVNEIELVAKLGAAIHAVGGPPAYMRTSPMCHFYIDNLREMPAVVHDALERGFVNAAENWEVSDAVFADVKQRLSDDRQAPAPEKTDDDGA